MGKQRALIGLVVALAASGCCTTAEPVLNLSRQMGEVAEESVQAHREELKARVRELIAVHRKKVDLSQEKADKLTDTVGDKYKAQICMDLAKKEDAQLEAIERLLKEKLEGAVKELEKQAATLEQVAEREKTVSARAAYYFAYAKYVQAAYYYADKELAYKKRLHDEISKIREDALAKIDNNVSVIKASEKYKLLRMEAEKKLDEAQRAFVDLVDGGKLDNPRLIALRNGQEQMHEYLTRKTVLALLLEGVMEGLAPEVQKFEGFLKGKLSTLGVNAENINLDLAGKLEDALGKLEEEAVELQGTVTGEIESAINGFHEGISKEVVETP